MKQISVIDIVRQTKLQERIDLAQVNRMTGSWTLEIKLNQGGLYEVYVNGEMKEKVAIKPT